MQLVSNSIRQFAWAFIACLIIFYFTGWLTFAFPFISQAEVAWPLVYYGVLLGSGVITAFILFFDNQIRKKATPIFTLAAFAMVIAFPHMSGILWKSFVVGQYLLCCIIVLMLAAGPKSILRLVATITAFNAVIGLAEAPFEDGLTFVIGRMAAFHENPNVLSQVLLLGTAVSLCVIPKRWQFSFVVLIGSAIIVTLSRTGMFSCVILLVLTIPHLLYRWRYEKAATKRDMRRASFVGGALLIWLSLAFLSNDLMRVSSVNSFVGARAAITDLEKKLKPLENQMSQLFDLLSAGNDGSIVSPSSDNFAKAFLEVFNNLEADTENSAASRVVLLLRSYLAYSSGPHMGAGLNFAHEISPHNSFLLFAVAFGHVGWLFVPAFIGLALYIQPNLHGVIFAAVIALTSLFSHDIFLKPVLIGLIATGYGSLIASKDSIFDDKLGVALRVQKGIVIACVLIFMAILSGISTTGKSQEIVIKNGEIVRKDNNIFYYQVRRPDYSGIFWVQKNMCSGENCIYFTENNEHLKGDTQLGKNFYTPQPGTVNQLFRRAFIFSPIDESDPRNNGKQYKLLFHTEIHPLFYIILCITAVWTIFTVCWLRKTE